MAPLMRLIGHFESSTFPLIRKHRLLIFIFNSLNFHFQTWTRSKRCQRQISS